MERLNTTGLKDSEDGDLMAFMLQDYGLLSKSHVPVPRD